jgi:drug/metabolite transporter (DMT)-like permease
MWMAIAGTCLALHFVTWFLSLDFTSVASSTVLVAIQPLLVAAMSASLLNEAPNRLEWIGIGSAVAGATIVGWGDMRVGEGALLGDGLALGAAAMLALYVIAGRRVRIGLGLWSYVFVVYAVAAIVTALLAAAFGIALTGYPGSTWLAFLGLAVGPMMLGHTGFNWALRHVRAYVVSVLQLLEPITATTIAVVVLGRREVPGASTLVGGTILLLGVWISLRAARGGWRGRLSESRRQSAANDR